MANGEKLNVILHGTFAYIDKEGVNFIDALMPLPGEGVDHVFRAGNWLGETELQKGTYQLRGVITAGGARFDSASNLIFQNGCPRLPRDGKKAHARLILPRPASIFSLRLAEVDLTKKPPTLHGEKAAAIQVFA